MTWVRIDDQFDEHPKHQQAGPLAWALWSAGLAYCNRNLTDGFIPHSKAQTLVNWQFSEPPDDQGRRRLVTVGITSGCAGDDVTNEYVIKLLLSAGLWEPCEGGYLVHDYKDYQPSRRQVLEQRKQTAQRVSRFKQRKANAKGNAVTNVVNGSVGNAESNAVSNAKVTPAPVPGSTKNKNSESTSDGDATRQESEPSPASTPVGCAGSEVAIQDNTNLATRSREVAMSDRPGREEREQQREEYERVRREEWAALTAEQWALRISQGMVPPEGMEPPKKGQPEQPW